MKKKHTGIFIKIISCYLHKPITLIRQMEINQKMMTKEDKIRKIKAKKCLPAI